MAKLDENDTLIPLPESMLPDFDTGGKIDPVVVGKVVPESRYCYTRNYLEGYRNNLGYAISPSIDYERLAAMIAAKVVAMTRGTCKCGKTTDVCCQAT